MHHYIAMSLETHLFFARIMKEHSLFLQVGFQQPGEQYKKKVDWYREKWEEFLEEVVKISNGLIREEVLTSGEIVTEYTKKAEKRTGFLTGVAIDLRITEEEERLRANGPKGNMWEVGICIRRLNRTARNLIRGLIDLKQEILKEVNSCQLFTGNYPLLLEHIIREAKLYHSIISELDARGRLSSNNLRRMEQFWNQIMMEHALFIRGLLDPSEEELIKTADGFAKDYKRLLEEAREKENQTLDELTRKTLEETIKYRDFKVAGTQGIIGCNISSLILPLLADHVLREANHYLRILTMGSREGECAYGTM